MGGVEIHPDGAFVATLQGMPRGALALGIAAIMAIILGFAAMRCSQSGFARQIQR
jgi:hypothetical protein